MVGWIILAVLAILILLVFFLPYGVDVGYADEVLRDASRNAAALFGFSALPCP